MSRTRLQAFYVLPVLLWMGVIFFASTGAGNAEHSSRLLLFLLGFAQAEVGTHIAPETLHTLNFLIRKAAHITEYAILTLLVVRAIQFGASRLKPQAVIGAAAISLLYACGDEFHQRFVAGRTSTPVDVVIDSVGIFLVMVGILIFFAVKSFERALSAHAALPNAEKI